MLKKILPIVLLLVGSGAGVGAGIFLRPAPEVMEEAKMPDDEMVEEKTDKKSAKEDADGDAPVMDYVKLSNQFVVPIVKERKVSSLVVLSLSLEVPDGSSEAVFAREPKLRDSFLQVLFDHANVGGFDGAFTEANNLNVLRRGLREDGQKNLGAEILKDVLILEIARQDY